MNLRYCMSWAPRIWTEDASNYKMGRFISREWADQCPDLQVSLLFFSHWVLSDFLVTPWTVSHQAPLSMGFSRQEYWSGLPFPSPGDLPYPGIKPRSPVAPTLTDKLYHWATWVDPSFTYRVSFNPHLWYRYGWGKCNLEIHLTHQVNSVNLPRCPVCLATDTWSLT